MRQALSPRRLCGSASIQHNQLHAARCRVHGDVKAVNTGSQASMREAIKSLEERAAAAHLEAQQLNRQGEFAGANAKYREMQQLEADALSLAKQLAAEEQAQLQPEGPLAKGTAGIGGAAVPVIRPCSWIQAATNKAAAESLQQRAHSAVVGCLVGDAAAMGVQWIYNTQDLAELEDQRRQKGTAADAGAVGVGLEFMDPPASPFLPGYASGRQSPYGEETLSLLRSLGQQGGALDVVAYADRFEADFGEGFDGYRNAATRGFLRNREIGLREPPACGSDDYQANCITRLAPLVAAFAGDAGLMPAVEAAARVTQNVDTAVAWGCAAAAALERIMLGRKAFDAVVETVAELRAGSGRIRDYGLGPEIADRFQAVLDMVEMDHPEAVEKLGRNCHLPNSCQTPLHAVLHHEWREQQQGRQGDGLGAGPSAMFAAAIRDALRGGGCCASRAGFAGACLGALLGPDAIPASWAARTSSHAEVLGLADAICGARDP